jgi:hypothetical protein
MESRMLFSNTDTSSLKMEEFYSHETLVPTCQIHLCHYTQETSMDGSKLAQTVTPLTDIQELPGSSLGWDALLSRHDVPGFPQSFK